MSHRLGAVTIGQAPRVDIVPELQVFLGADVEIVEAGALDGLSSEAVARLSPEPADQVLVTRMRDGESRSRGATSSPACSSGWTTSSHRVRCSGIWRAEHADVI